MDSIKVAGIQYIGSISTRPGYPSNDNPASHPKHLPSNDNVDMNVPATPNRVWKTSGWSPGLSAIPPPSGS